MAVVLPGNMTRALVEEQQLQLLCDELARKAEVLDLPSEKKKQAQEFVWRHKQKSQARTKWKRILHKSSVWVDGDWEDDGDFDVARIAESDRLITPDTINVFRNLDIDLPSFKKVLFTECDSATRFDRWEKTLLGYCTDKAYG